MIASADFTRCMAYYQCGPVRLSLEFEDARMRDALHGLLNQYDAPWPAPEATVHVNIGTGEVTGKMAGPAGVYLQSYRLRVDREGTHIFSLSNIGVGMDYDFSAGNASILVPPDPDWQTLVEETEQQLVLLLARAWAQQGWTPLHAGSLVPKGGRRCLLFCAPSGVGKTTLIATMLRRGWNTLGDDKILLRREDGVMRARSLARRFHLHPSTARWIPETGDFSAWPHYSRWTDKRVVPIEGLWPGQLLPAAVPAVVVLLERAENGLSVEPMDQQGALKALLQQVVLPSDSGHARPLVSCIAGTAANIRSARVRIGHDAFSDARILQSLDEAFCQLLT